MKPNFIFVQSRWNNIFINDIPKDLKFNSDTKYRLICCTVHKPGHFLGVYYINNNYYLADDLKRSFNLIIQPTDPLNYSKRRSIRDSDDQHLIYTLATTCSMYY